MSTGEEAGDHPTTPAIPQPPCLELATGQHVTWQQWQRAGAGITYWGGVVWDALGIALAPAPAAAGHRIEFRKARADNWQLYWRKRLKHIRPAT